MRSLLIGPVIASRAIVALLKIQRRTDPTLVFMVSGRLDAENVGELCQLIDAEPAGAVVVLDLTDLVLADGDAIRQLSGIHPRLDGRRGQSLSHGLQNIDCSRPAILTPLREKHRWRTPRKMFYIARDGRTAAMCLFSASYFERHSAGRQTPSVLNARDAARVSSASCSNLIFPCSATRRPA
jgi:hypothetical protein